MAIGDVHAPYTDWKLVKKIVSHIKQIQPTHVVQMGDLYDLYSFSRYAKTLNLETPKSELRRARAGGERLWEMVQDAAPNAKCHGLWGNHDDRLFKTILSKAPELEALTDIIDVKKFWRFDGVKMQPDSRTELVIGGIMFQHGHRSKLGDHMGFNHCNTVVGHSHHGGVVYKRIRGETLWELNAGAVPDANSLPMSYTAQKLSSSVFGYGLVDEFGPRFIPL